VFVTDFDKTVCILAMQRPDLLLKVIKCSFSKKSTNQKTDLATASGKKKKGI
jgi:hypothetical protein